MFVRVVRIVLIAVGAIVAWHGISLLLDMHFVDLRSVVFWFAGGIIVHDGIFAPLCVAFGFAGRRVLPPTWWAPVVCGGVCTVTLLALAVPVIARHGAVADNASVLDQNYGAGLVTALLLVWVITGFAVWKRHSGSKRQLRG